MYYALQRCTAPQRQALQPLWQFHRQVRGIVTGVSDAAVAQAKLAWWRAQVDALSQGRAEHPTLRALAPVVRQHGLPASALLAVIDSVAIDLQQNRWLDRPALLHYAMLSGGQMLRNAAALLDVQTSEDLDAAQALGTGLRLADFIRHLGRDAAQGRVYVALDALQRHGVTAADLQQRRMHPGVAALLAEQTGLARQTLDDAMRTLGQARRGHATPLLALGAMAQAVLREIERSDYAVLHQRISLTPLRKLWISRTCTWRRG